MPPRPNSDMDRNIRRKKARTGNPSGNNQPPSLPHHKLLENTRNLNGRPVYPSRFYHTPTMATLGAHEQLQIMFKNIGWQDYLGKSAMTYPNLTIEFLQTYAYDVEQRVITFSLNDTRFTSLSTKSTTHLG